MDGEAGVVDPKRPTAAWWHFHEPLPQTGDGADTVRERRGHDRGVEALARFQHEDRPELLGYAVLEGSEHQVG